MELPVILLRKGNFSPFASFLKVQGSMPIMTPLSGLPAGGSLLYIWAP